jgi:hypothetical protein
MQERRRNAKYLPEIFLLLQLTAMLLFSYISYEILINLQMPQGFLFFVLAVANVYYTMRFYSRYLVVKNRTKYLHYTNSTDGTQGWKKA